MMHHHLIQLLISAALLAATIPIYLRVSNINQFFFFGRSLPAAFTGSAAAAEITHRYRKQMKTGVMMSFCVLLVFGSGLLHVSPFAALSIALLYQCVFFQARFAQAHRRAGEAFRNSGIEATMPDDDAGVVSVVLADQAEQTHIGIVQMLLPAMVSLAVWVAAVTIGHIGFAGLDSTVETIGGAGLFGLSMGMLFASTALLFLLRFSARYRTPLARRSLKLSLVLGWISAALFAGICAAAVAHYRLTPMLGRVITAVIVAFAFLQSVYTWINKKRYVPPTVERNGDEFWRWGLYYYNAGDPALFVQSRCWPGYTLNFANIFSWPIALAVVADFGFLFFLSLRK